MSPHPVQGALGDSLKQTSTVTIAANNDPYGYFVIINLQRPVRVDEAAKGWFTFCLC